MDETHWDDDSTDAFLPFFLAGTWLAVPVSSVELIGVRQGLTALPYAPTRIVGLTNVERRTYPLLDLEHWLELQASDELPDGMNERARTLVIRDGLCSAAFDTSNTMAVLRIGQAAIKPPTVIRNGRIQQYLIGEFDASFARIGLINVALLLTDAQLHSASAMTVNS